MDCLNRDIMMVWGNELLMGLEGQAMWNGFSVFYQQNASSCWLGVSRTWSVFHIYIYPLVADVVSSLLAVKWLQLKCFLSSS